MLTSATTKPSGSSAFPTLGEAITPQQQQAQQQQVLTTSTTSNNHTKHKKNSERNYIDPYDPLSSAVRFIDENIKFLSEYQPQSFKLKSNILDDATYNSYPSLFSFENIEVSQQSDNVLGLKLVDILAIKPVDYAASILPYLQNGPQISQQILQKSQQQLQQTPPSMTPQQLQAQLHQQQLQQQRVSSVNTPPPPGIFTPQSVPINQAGMMNNNNSNGNNSSDLLNQLINGKKVTAGS